MAQTGKASILFWIIGVIALLWNGAGVFAYWQLAMMSAEKFAALPELQRELMDRQPIWHSAAFPIAVFGGFIGAIAMLLKKRIAVRLFMLSLVGVIIQFAGYFILDGYIKFITTQGWTMPIMIPIFAVGFWLYARHCENKGIID